MSEIDLKSTSEFKKPKTENSKPETRNSKLETTMSLPLVIINPASAGGATGEAWPGVASDLRAQFGPFERVFTEKSGDASRLAAAAVRKGTRLIIACGGDGTVSEVANGILQTGGEAELGIIPSGTGGDFRRSLKIPAVAREAAAILKQGCTRLIDVGRVTFVGHDELPDTRFFLGVASFGMSVEVIERVKGGGPDWIAKGPRWLSGRLSYAFSTVQTALVSPIKRVVVQIDDGVERHLTVTNLCIANARYFGGGMKIAPEAKLNDGRFDVISIGNLGARRILLNAPRLYTGTHLSLDQVNHVLAHKVVVRPAEKDQQLPIEVDGELLGRLPATFQIVPRALRVRSPEKKQ